MENESETTTQIGEILCVIDAQKSGYRQSKGGIVVSFTIHPNDPHNKLMELDLHEVVRLYVTKPKIGI